MLYSSITYYNIWARFFLLIFICFAYALPSYSRKLLTFVIRSNCSIFFLECLLYADNPPRPNSRSTPRLPYNDTVQSDCPILGYNAPV